METSIYLSCLKILTWPCLYGIIYFIQGLLVSPLISSKRYLLRDAENLRAWHSGTHLQSQLLLTRLRWEAVLNLEFMASLNNREKLPSLK